MHTNRFSSGRNGNQISRLIIVHVSKVYDLQAFGLVEQSPMCNVIEGILFPVPKLPGLEILDILAI